MPQILRTIEILPGLEYHTFNGVTGINVSGGADSALLLYLTMMFSENPIRILTLGNNQRYRRNVKAATEVVERCIQLTGNTNIKHFIHYADVQNFEALNNMLTYHRDSWEIDVMLGGMTQNPPTEVTDEFELEVTETERNPGTERESLVKVGDKIVGFKPFVNVDKKVIAEIYKKYDIVDDLFSVTRSCEFDPTSNFFHTRKIIDPGMGHCGRCWWCEERKWAFGRLT
jgi:7-cyano-7-deazaguanine synthase in queuosine biosynthesis